MLQPFLVSREVEYKLNVVLFVCPIYQETTLKFREARKEKDGI